MFSLVFMLLFFCVLVLLVLWFDETGNTANYTALLCWLVGAAVVLTLIEHGSRMLTGG